MGASEDVPDRLAVSRSLVQALTELKGLRTDFMKTARVDPEKLEMVIERTEKALRIEAEHALNLAIVQEPSIQQEGSFHATEFKSASPAWKKRIKQRARARSARRSSHAGGHALAADPKGPLKAIWTTDTPTTDAARSFLQDRFGIPESHAPPQGRDAGSGAVGGVFRGATVGPAVVLPKDMREDPYAQVPTHLADLVAHQGLFELTNKRIIPPTADLTDTINGDGGVVSTERAALLPASSKHYKGYPTTALEDALLSSATNNVQLDMLTPVQRPVRDGPRVNRDTDMKVQNVNEQQGSAYAIRSRATKAKGGDMAEPDVSRAGRINPETGELSPDEEGWEEGEDGALRGPDVMLPGQDGRDSTGPIEDVTGLRNALAGRLKGGADWTRRGIEGRTSAEPARDYDAMQDAHALHEFMIRKGTTVDSTPEFMSFHRTYLSHWMTIAHIILQLEGICTQYAVPLAVIDGKALAAFAAQADARGGAPSMEELLYCIKNIQEVAMILRQPGRRFYGPNGHDLAARAIQGAARRFAARLRLARESREGIAAAKIQSRWRATQLRKRLLQEMAEARAERDATFAAQQAEMAASWDDTHAQHRVIVHLPSLTLDGRPAGSFVGGDELRALQNSQIARICDVADDMVDVILVTAKPMDADVVGYWHKLLEVTGIEDPASRVRMIYPENHHRLPIGMSLAAQLLASPRALKRIRMYARGRPGYIVPGNPGPAEMDLSVQLGLPLLAPHPAAAQALGTKSAARALFAAAAMNVAPGCAVAVGERKKVHARTSALKPGTAFEFLPGGEIRVTEPGHDGRPSSARSIDSMDSGGARTRRRRDEFFVTALAELMVAHPHTQRWLAKLEDEWHGRGHAYVDIASMPPVEEALERYILAVSAAHPGASSRALLIEEAHEVAVYKVAAALRESLPRRLMLAAPEVYGGYKRYIEALRKRGGVVEACPTAIVGSPTVNLFIEPTGGVRVLSTHEQVFSPAYRTVGYSFPQASVPSAALCDAAVAVGMAAHGAGVIGHVEVDFVALREGGALRLWGVDINLCPSNSLNMFQFFDFLVAGEFDPYEGAYVVPDDDEEDRPQEMEWGDALDASDASPPSTAPRSLSTSRSLSQRGVMRRDSSAKRMDSLREEGDEVDEGRAMASAASGASGADSENLLQRRYYVSLDCLAHPGLKPLRYGQFFRACRQQGFCFDLRERLGVSFNLFDSLLGGQIGVISVGLSPYQAFVELAQTMDFITTQVAESGAPAPDGKATRAFKRTHGTVKYLTERLRPAGTAES